MVVAELSSGDLPSSLFTAETTKELLSSMKNSAGHAIGVTATQSRQRQAY
jgi:hypothetical protein